MKKTIILFFIAVFISVSIHSQPRIWNMTTMENAKINSSEAIKLIIKEADKNLNKTILSVMDKEMTPPSGDKHDYWSSGRYWWPDPKKADGLPYIRKDGVVNREIDNLDRSPLSTMSKSVTTLSLAYYFTNDEKYAEKAVQNLRIWFINKKTKMNPNMNFGQTIPGHNNGKGRGEGLIDTYSFIEMLDGIELLKKSDEFLKKDRLVLNDWFSAYLEWMLTSEIAQQEFNAKNNHGTAYDVQVTRYALFVGKVEIAKRFINEFPERRIFAQVEPDGSQPLELARTTALGYSIFNITHFLDMCCIAKSLNIDLFNSTSTDGRNISKAIHYLSNFAGKSESEFPYKQIKDWDSKQKELIWLLYRADKFVAKPVYQKFYSNNNSELNKKVELLFY